MFFHKLCETKLVDPFETNNFVFLRFFRISHIIVKKLNFGFSIFFFNYKEKYASYEKILQLLRQNNNLEFANVKSIF